jgi:hypothetical protein
LISNGTDLGIAAVDEQSRLTVTFPGPSTDAAKCTAEWKKSAQDNCDHPVQRDGMMRREQVKRAIQP